MNISQIKDWLLSQDWQVYLRSILEQRDWSWMIIGAAYLLSALIIRGFFLNPVIRYAKQLDRKHYNRFKQAYLQRCVLGWIFFLVPFFILIGVWNSSVNLPVSEIKPLAIAALACYILSIVLHIGAVAAGALVALKKFEDENRKSA